MSIDIQLLCRQILPSSTLLVFGAGSSIPSGAPSGIQLRDELGKEFRIEEYQEFSLPDLSYVIEQERGRKALIEYLRKRILPLQPQGGIQNLPLYDWPAIYTTNYDEIIEKVYKRKGVPLNVYPSNFDFGAGGGETGRNLFKFHGTIAQDISDGHQSRIVISSIDYDNTSKYREILYGRMQDHFNRHSVLIIGHSLSDPDLNSVIDRAQQIKNNFGGPGTIYLFIYQINERLAKIYEARNFVVCFGGIDDFLPRWQRGARQPNLFLSFATTY